MNLPLPQQFVDGVQFFYAMHKVVFEHCKQLEELLNDAESTGLPQSIEAHSEWKNIFEFFMDVAPLHERDEEQFLFPRVIEKVPHLGFQQPDAPIHFLIEGHKMLRERTAELAHKWGAIRRGATASGTSSVDPAEDRAFVTLGRSLIQLYREHATMENTKVYPIADEMMTVEEKTELRDALCEQHAHEGAMSVLPYDEPQFSRFGPYHVVG